MPWTLPRKRMPSSPSGISQTWRPRPGLRSTSASLHPREQRHVVAQQPPHHLAVTRLQFHADEIRPEALASDADPAAAGERVQHQGRARLGLVHAGGAPAEGLRILVEPGEAIPPALVRPAVMPAAEAGII